MVRSFAVLLFLLLTAGFVAYGQQISVRSFRALPHDLDALQNYPLKDQNGEVCAIVKVVTPEKGFYFDIGSLGITKTEQRIGEIWVYVPHGARRISIFHDKLGVVRDYFFTEPIEQGVCYELVLVTGRLLTTVLPAELDAQWLLITAHPDDAMIYVNDRYEAKGTLQKKLLPGRYTYRVEAPLHHTEAGAFDLDDKDKKEINCRLKPNFGFIEVASLPEPGAVIMLDGQETGLITPATTGRLQSGSHTVRVVKEQYNPVAAMVTVTDSDTTRVALTMTPNFALVTLNAPAAASVLIDEVPKGYGNWQGRLSPGVYSVEARLDRHHPDRHDIVLEAGEPLTLTLQPRERAGHLDITSTPPGAAIRVDGTDRGTTPATLKNLLMGSYTIEISRASYGTFFTSATVAEGETATVKALLKEGRPVIINSLPTPAGLYIDSVKAGVTPWRGSLHHGSHLVTVEHAGKRASKTIDVVPADAQATYSVVIGPESFIETVNGISFRMINIGGGTFLMGSEAGDPDEQPVHHATVSDFAMAATEVTQALWKAVMGASAPSGDPSRFKGDDLPVERVNWNDVQVFLAKLNQLTGKNYRLPTEAEWEFAAATAPGTATDRSVWAGTNQMTDLDDYAWYYGNSEKKTHPAGTRKPNALGLYDMSGNVWEWCADLYEPYTPDGQARPRSKAPGSHRVFRGGSWSDNPAECTTFNRSRGNPHNSYYNLGFRLALTL